MIAGSLPIVLSHSDRRLHFIAHLQKFHSTPRRFALCSFRPSSLREFWMWQGHVLLRAYFDEVGLTHGRLGEGSARKVQTLILGRCNALLDCVGHASKLKCVVFVRFQDETGKNRQRQLDFPVGTARGDADAVQQMHGISR